MSNASGIYDAIDVLERCQSWEEAKPTLMNILHQLAYYTTNSEGVVSEYGEEWRGDWRDSMIANISSDNREIMEQKIKEGRRFNKQTERAQEIGRQKSAAHRRRESYGDLSPALRAIMDGNPISKIQ